MLASSSSLLGVILRNMRTMYSIVTVIGFITTITTRMIGRDDQRHAVGIGERVCLRQHGGEDDDEERHDGGGVGDADLADEQDGETRGKCRGQHVDQRVADEDRADHLLWPLQQLVHQRRTAIAFLLQRMHAGARSGGQRRLAAVEEGRQRDQHDDRQENERGNE